MNASAATLRELPQFSRLNDHELQVLASILHSEVFAGGDIIFREGDLGRSCYFLVKGEVEIVKSLPGGGSRVLATLQRHDVFGQISLIDSGPRSAAARAAGSIMVYRLNREDFDTLFSSGSRFAFQFQLGVARAAASQLREANRRLNLLLETQRSGVPPTRQEQVFEELHDLLSSSDRHTPDDSGF